MKCPRCGLVVTDRVPRCRGCGFSLDDLARRLKRLPLRKGYVNDMAGLLSATESTRLEARLGQLQQQLGGELVVVTLRSSQPLKPSEYLFWLFNHWQVGGSAHLGLMLLLAQKERRIECEVGYGWEPLLSERRSGQVLDEYMLPQLKAGNVYEALRQGCEQLAGIIAQATPAGSMPPERGQAAGDEP